MRSRYRFTANVVALSTVIVTLMISNVASATGDSGGAVRTYNSSNSPNVWPWPFYDFIYGQYKAECYSGGTIVGISADTGGTLAPVSVLCETVGTQDTLFAQGTSTPTADETDENFSSSNSTDYGNHGGDWDSGYLKGECPVGSMVVGIGQTTDSTHQVNHLHCSSTATMCATYHDAYRSNTTCHKINLADGTNTAWGNWTTGNKVSCASGEVVQGVSTDTTNHHPHAILCCQAPSTNC